MAREVSTDRWVTPGTGRCLRRSRGRGMPNQPHEAGLLMSRGRMAAQLGLEGSNDLVLWAIESEGSDGGAPGGGDADHGRLRPSKVMIPHVEARIEKGDHRG